MSWKPFTPDEEQKISDAIQSAEMNCSGEIRVHIDQYCKGDPLFKARNTFGHLKMTDTKDRNGILIYVALEDKKFSIVGDEGIHQNVHQEFWDHTRDVMLNDFKAGKIVDAISKGVIEAGVQLKKYFPYQEDDKNELSDDISYGS